MKTVSPVPVLQAGEISERVFIGEKLAMVVTAAPSELQFSGRQK